MTASLENLMESKLFSLEFERLVGICIVSGSSSLAQRTRGQV